MASTTQSRHRGWWCAPELLVVAILAATLLRGRSGVTVVPVVVSTMYRSVPSVVDVAAGVAGTLLLLTNSGEVHRGLPNGATVQVVATISSGVFHYGITCDVAANVAYVTGWSTNRVYKLGLSTANVSAFAGSGTAGSADGVGTAAQFNGPCGVVYYAPTGLLYVAEFSSFGAIRKIVVATVNVTTVATILVSCTYLCVTANGTLLYVTTDTKIVVVRTTMINNVTALAGSTTEAYKDGVGAAAQFNEPRGIVLNSDESALIIADRSNCRIRRLELSANNVTTIAGSSTAGGADGPGLSATFNYPCGATWHCNQSSMLCGSLVVDSQDSTVRFVAIEDSRVTASVFKPSSGTASGTAGIKSSSRSVTDVMKSSSWWGTASATAGMKLSSRSATDSLTTSTSYCGTLSEPPSTSFRSSKLSNSATRNTYRNSASPSMLCFLVPGDASGALVSLHRVELTPGTTVVALSSTKAADDANVSSDGSVTEPVSRQTLLGGYALAANMTLTLGGTLRGVDDAADGWTPVGALRDVVTTDAAFPVLSCPVEVTVVSSRVVGREQLLVCLLWPPNGTGSPRWLPSTLTFRDVTLRLRLRLRCTTDASVTQDVVFVVPSPGQAVTLVTEVKAAGAASQYASWVGAPAAGSAVGRLSAVRSLVQCGEDASAGGMLQFAVDCEDGVVASSSAADACGAVLGNLVLWAAGCALMALLTCGYSRCAAVPLRTAAEALGVPSPLLPLVVATVPSTASSTFVLLRSSCSADIAVATLGVVMCLVPSAVLWGLVVAVSQRLHATQNLFIDAPVALCMSARRIRTRLLQRRLRWTVAPFARVRGQLLHQRSSDAATPLAYDAAVPGQEAHVVWLMRVATVVLLEYAVVWYLCVDIAVLTAAGFLGAVSTLGSLAACRGSAVAVAALYAGQVVLCAAVRPYTTLLSHVHTLFCLTLGAVSVWCQVWYLFASDRDGANPDTLGALLTVSAVCDIVVSAASMLKTLMDVVEALRACRRHVLVVMARTNGSWMIEQLTARVGDGGTIAECPVLRAVCTPPTLVDDVAVDEDVPADVGDLLAEYDAHFWRSDGSAAIDCDAFVVGAAAVGVSCCTALDDMQRRHRGDVHDQMLHFGDAVFLE